MSGRRIGILGGTFDPVHIGHLLMASEASCGLRLEEVVLMPAGRPPHKPHHVPAPAHHRTAMLAAAIAGETGMRVGRIDLDRPPPHYTVDMLRLARQQWALDGEDLLWFIVGGDSLEDLPTWRSPLEILQTTRLAAIDRPGYAPCAGELEAVLPGLSSRVDRIVMPPIGISGSDIRARVAAGRPIRWHVPRTVEAYIFEHGLYRVASEP